MPVETDEDDFVMVGKTSQKAETKGEPTSDQIEKSLKRCRERLDDMPKDLHKNALKVALFFFVFALVISLTERVTHLQIRNNSLEKEKTEGLETISQLQDELDKMKEIENQWLIKEEMKQEASGAETDQDEDLKFYREWGESNRVLKMKLRQTYEKLMEDKFANIVMPAFLFIFAVLMGVAIRDYQIRNETEKTRKERAAVAAAIVASAATEATKEEEDVEEEEEEEEDDNDEEEEEEEGDQNEDEEEGAVNEEEDDEDEDDEDEAVDSE
ncbi:hypothetical protein L5515_012021 [Caenorhabditis briggsae]|nr:hypothetical protein L5515_012021 [Caenorhabditis briggsae]